MKPESEESLVSIIIPLYNANDFIEETLNSLIKQTYHNWEAIVIDDNSSDGSFEKTSKVARNHDRIKLFRKPESLKRGASVSRNFGVAKAFGEYLVFLDADDLLSIKCLENRVKVMKENPELDFAVFPMMLFNTKIDDLRILVNVDNPQKSDLERFLNIDPVWAITSPIWKKKAFVNLGGFDTELNNVCEDHDLFIKALISNLKYLKLLDIAPDCFYRKGHSGTSLSVQSNYNPALVLAKEKALNKTINLLENSNNRYFIRYCKGFLIDLFISYSYIGDFKKAEEIINMASSLKVFSIIEVLLSKVILKTYSYKLHNVKGYYRFRSILLMLFNGEPSSLYKFKYEKEIV